MKRKMAFTICLCLKKKYILKPGDQFKLGDLEFRLERYNTGVASRERINHLNEDRYKVIQDMGIDEHMKWSYFAVYDGHGKAHWSQFLAKTLHKALKANLMDKFDGIKNRK